MPEALTRVLEEVRAERARQDAKWGDQRKHPASLWGLILAEEVGEFSAAVLDGDPALARRELVQVAAVAAAAIESLDAQGDAELLRDPAMDANRKALRTR